MQKEDSAILAQSFAFPWTTLDASLEKWASYFKEHANRNRFVAVIEIENYLIGYASLLRYSKYPPFREGNIPEINDLWIKDTYRRQGLAKKLIAFLERTARSEDYLQIGIGVGLYHDYGVAQSLYCRLGYVPDSKGITYKNVQVIPGESYPVDDDLVLWFIKSLKQSENRENYNI